MPVNANDELLMWYLTPSPEIDRVISEHNWSKRTIYFWTEPWTEKKTKGILTVGRGPKPANYDGRSKEEAVPEEMTSIRRSM